mmetsp:Transcript_8627/g.13006  ORF Transcript_8627/g.13006 Transcript_8627/m.13006 type:complete len:89 (+) Transcript_8627:114-380(+)
MTQTGMQEQSISELEHRRQCCIRSLHSPKTQDLSTCDFTVPLGTVVLRIVTLFHFDAGVDLDHLRLRRVISLLNFLARGVCNGLLLLQ